MSFYNFYRLMLKAVSFIKRKFSFIQVLISFLIKVLICMQEQRHESIERKTNREMALVVFWEVSVQILGGNKLQHSVPKKLQSLVMTPAANSIKHSETLTKQSPRLWHYSDSVWCPHVRMFSITQHSCRQTIPSSWATVPTWNYWYDSNSESVHVSLQLGKNKI